MKFVVRFILSTFAILIVNTSVHAQQARQDSLKEIQRQIDILTQEIEKMKLGEASETNYQPVQGLGPAAAHVYSLKKSGASLAGYGEITYQNYSKKRDNGADANALNRIDYLRNVLYVGFRFNDWIVFNSELEFEHASTGEGAEERGEVSVEFGYVDLMFSKHFNIRAGMVLIPVGIINEKHEPSTYFGTLRPQVERSIIPSTWRGIGVGAYGELAPSLHYRGYIIEGLSATGFSANDGIRGGRQDGSNAIAQDLGVTGKLEYTGIAGGTLGASFYLGNSGQGAADASGDVNAFTSVWSLHGEYAWQGLELCALYAQTSIDQADRVSVLTGEAIGSSAKGFYVVAGYDVLPMILPGTSHYLAPFIQYEQLNTQASVASGYAANKATDRSTLTFGFSYKPHPNVAFKFDYRDNKNEAGTGLNQWNLAVNYLF